MICIGFVILFIVMALFNHFCNYGRNDFWDKIYDITDWAIMGVGFIACFELFFTLVFFGGYKSTINGINNLYKDIYALEPHLNETRIVFITQSKIDEYEREKDSTIFIGRLTGFDTSEIEAFPTLNINDDGTITES